MDEFNIVKADNITTGEFTYGDLQDMMRCIVHVAEEMASAASDPKARISVKAICRAQADSLQDLALRFSRATGLSI